MRSPNTSYRLAIALRVVAAILGGYALAALVTFALAKFLPMSRSEASLTATLLSFLVYACLAIWVFAKRKAEGFRQAMAWLHTWSFTMAALLFALLPALNALTTDTHLGETLARGNWVYAGFDLTMFGLGALLALVAWHAGRAPGKLAKSRKKPLESPMAADAGQDARMPGTQGCAGPAVEQA